MNGPQGSAVGSFGTATSSSLLLLDVVEDDDDDELCSAAGAAAETEGGGDTSGSGIASGSWSSSGIATVISLGMSPAASTSRSTTSGSLAGKPQQPPYSSALFEDLKWCDGVGGTITKQACRKLQHNASMKHCATCCAT